MVPKTIDDGVGIDRNGAIFVVNIVLVTFKGT